MSGENFYQPLAMTTRGAPKPELSREQEIPVLIPTYLPPRGNNHSRIRLFDDHRPGVFARDLLSPSNRRLQCAMSWSKVRSPRRVQPLLRRRSTTDEISKTDRSRR